MRLAAGLVRKVGMLHKMLDAASNGDLKYSKVLAYVDSLCVEEEVKSGEGEEEDDASSTWSTPRNSNRQVTDAKPTKRIVPSEELRRELWYDSQGHSLLRKAVLKSAPHKLLAKLCDLCPEAARVEDSKGRLVLHHACRLPVTDQTEVILMLLLQTHVLGALHRDQGGRTPLHYLFWYHAPSRSTEIVEAFCGRVRKTKFYALRQQEPDPTSNLPPLPAVPMPNASHSIPNTAAIIPDAQHGCLPLHYAVMEGASVDAIKVLLQAYPLSKHVVDRYGQTPLHWYLGSHYLSKPTHVSGCDRDPNALPWYQTAICPRLVRLLSSSRVARTGDNQGRTPLHWAAAFWAHAYHYQAQSEDPTTPEAGTNSCPLSIANAKLVLDHHIGALGQKDLQQQTPLMVLFQTTYQLQLSYKGPLFPPRFSPPLACVQLLMEGGVFDGSIESEKLKKSVEHFRGKRKGYVTTLENDSGDLPLHAALQTAAPSDIVQSVLEGHPVALLHGNDQSRVPLHAAFGSSHSAQLQDPQVISLMLSKTVLDGRLALKMEDSQGYYPIHLACQHNASLTNLKTMIQAYPKTALLPSQNGVLPIHMVVPPHVLVSALSLGSAAATDQMEEGNKDDLIDDATALRQERQRLFATQSRQKHLHEIQETRSKIWSLIEPILQSDKVHHFLNVPDEGGYLPLHLLVLFGAEYSLLLRMLRAFPAAALQLTYDGRSVLDLHEQRLYQQDWKEVRQLLFSFAPTLESHRHRVGLLTQCVQIVAQEVLVTSTQDEQKLSSFHWRAEQKLIEEEESRNETLDLQVTHSLSKTLEAVKSALSQHAIAKVASQTSRQNPRKTAGSKGKFRTGRYKAHRQKSRVAKSFELAPSVSDGEPTGSVQTQSKYDDGDTRLIYNVSDTEYDEDDSYFSGEENEEEEYLTEDEHSESEDDTILSDNRDSTLDATATRSFSDSKSLDAFHLLSSHSTLEDIFMAAKLKAMQEDEEKKDEMEARSRDEDKDLNIDATMSSKSLVAPACSSEDSLLSFAVKPEWFSEVGIRLWTFFALYRDPNNPNDNYSTQVANVFNEIEYECVQSLATLPLPSCSRSYFPETTSKDLKRLTFREAAHPKCREFIHRMCFFLGSYQFKLDDGSDIALYQSDDGSSVIVRAYEWIFTTEESTEAAVPGVSEASIWNSGEIPAEVGLTFRTLRRPVRIHFTQRPDVYENEINCRIQAGVPVEGKVFGAVNKTIPLLNHYNANDTSRKENRIFLTDIHDSRFNQVQLFRGECTAIQDSMSLSDYPFALVYPDICTHSLGDLQARWGFRETAGIKKICADMGDALKQLHSKGVVHSNFSSGQIMLSRNPSSDNSSNSNNGCRQWILSGLSFSTPVRETPPLFAGGITSQGRCQYATGTLPPEMFTKLSPAELQLHQKYWETVENKFGIKVDKKAVEPIVDVATGQTFGVKCHFLPLTISDGAVVVNNSGVATQLPYELVEVTSYMDLWAFGLVIFQLCAGRPLFPTDSHTGHLLSYEGVCNWTSERAKEFVYEHISDCVAQDVILRLLTPYEARKAETMEVILKHPFFSEGEHAATSITTSTMIAKRQMEAASYKRQLQSKLMEVSETLLLEERTVRITCWDFKLLERIHASPTDTLTRLMPPQPWRREGTVLPFPGALVVLPYRLGSSSQGDVDNASPETDNIGLAFGKEYIAFSKSVYFATLLKRKKESSKSNTDQHSTKSSKWSVDDVFDTLGLSSEDFGDVKTRLSDLASMHVFQFRENPLAIALKVVQQSLESLLAHFGDDTSSAFLYLIDEFGCTPAISDKYPLEVQGHRKNDLLKNIIALMHLSTLYGRGCSGGLTGLFKLFVDNGDVNKHGRAAEAAGGVAEEVCTVAAAVSPPSSWAEAAEGLVHMLDEAQFVDEMKLLQDVLSDMYSCKYRVATDDLAFLRDFLYDVDPKRTFADLRRVSTSGMCLWTSYEGSIEMTQAARSLSFRDALQKLAE